MRCLAALLVVVAAACGSSSSSAGPVTHRWSDGTVAAVGDSMLFDAANEFERLADERGWTVTIHARPGTTFADNRKAIDDVADRRGGAVVVELGTNDALSGHEFTDDEAAEVDRAVERLRDVGCVLFVNAGLLAHHDATPPPSRFWEEYSRGADAARALNRHLADAVDAHPNQHVFDWYRVFNNHLDWPRDLVHLKAEHQADYARLLVDALADACTP